LSEVIALLDNIAIKQALKRAYRTVMNDVKQGRLGYVVVQRRKRMGESRLS